MEVQACSMLADKCAPYLVRGQFSKLGLVPVLEKIDLSQDWSAPSVRWCAHWPARLKEVVGFSLH
eukprot:6571085-Heterocapsa_arctica.AAC.1